MGGQSLKLLTPRLLLREFTAADWPAVLAYQRDPRYLRYYTWTERTPEDAQAFVQMFIDQQRERPRTRYQLAVTLRDGGRLIGNCGVRLTAAGADEGEIGYELAPDEWGHGYATEAGQAIVRFAFDTLCLRRLTAWTVADNIASARVLEKLGLRPEARLPFDQYYKGRWWDVVQYGTTNDERRVKSDE